MNGIEKLALAGEPSDARRPEAMDDDALADFLAGGLGSVDESPADDDQTLVAEPAIAPEATAPERAEPAAPQPVLETAPSMRVLRLIGTINKRDWTDPPKAATPAPEPPPSAFAGLEPNPTQVALTPSLRGSANEFAAACLDSAWAYTQAHPRRVGAGVLFLLVLVLWPGDPAPLPPYAIEGPFGGTVHEGSSATHLPMFASGDDVRVVVRPERAAEDVPDAWFLVIGPGGPVMLDEDHIEVDDRGVVRLEGMAGQLFDRPGRYQIFAAVGAEPEDPLNTPPDTIQFQVETEGGHWSFTELYYRP